MIYSDRILLFPFSSGSFSVLGHLFVYLFIYLLRRSLDLLLRLECNATISAETKQNDVSHSDPWVTWVNEHKVSSPTDDMELTQCVEIITQIMYCSED